MSKPWYSLFVSLEQEGQEGRPSEGKAVSEAQSAARAVADIAASVAKETKFTSPVSNAASFEEIYRAAEIRPPAHGYTIQKVGEMLQSEHIRTMPAEVKRSSILVALDAAGAKIQEVIKDAVSRDRALDTFERVQQKALDELQARKNQENQEIQAEIDRLVAERRARIQSNNEEVARQKEAFYSWRLKKQEEEQKIADTVAYFVTENPITTRGPAPTPPATSKPPGS